MTIDSPLVLRYRCLANNQRYDLNMVVRMRFLKVSVFVLLFSLYLYSEAEPETATAEPLGHPLNQGAEQGDPEAQFFLGQMYAEGESVPQDYGEAAKWYRLAAEQGMVEAQYELGRMYLNSLLTKCLSSD
jgi:Sel1 repeat